MLDLFHKEPFVFEIDPLAKEAEELHNGYVQAQPFPHVVIDDFLPLREANRLLRVFPGKDSDIWLDWKKRDVDHQPKKLGIGHASRLVKVSPYIQYAICI